MEVDCRGMGRFESDLAIMVSKISVTHMLGGFYIAAVAYTRPT